MYKDFHLAVFGDFMLDQWLEAEDIGICPGQAAIDFKNPKIIMQKPGGAGNQAMNVALLGAKCTVYLAYGGKDNDGNSRDLEYRLRDGGVNIIEYIEPFFITHHKNYYIHNGRLVFRESGHHCVYGESIIGMAEDLAENITDYDGVIIADYNKGVCTGDTIAMIMCAGQENNIPIFVDPKFTHWECYKGSVIFKCNQAEWDRVGHTVKNLSSLTEWLVITKSGKGLDIISMETGEQWNIPSCSGEVYDINGAGDSTMVAMVLEYLRTDGDILKAARVGNKAGGVCVGHKYTHQVTIDELKKAGAWDE